MKPADITALNSAGRPVWLPDGRLLVGVGHPDLDENRTASRLVVLDTHGGQRDFTAGPGDAGPVLSPDGATVVFTRAVAPAPPQLYAIPVDGGEARQLTAHPLGASSPVFSPDGRRIAYLAAVPEPGRYGTDEKISSDAEAPRRFTSLSYRRDNLGFVLDRPDQIFVIDASVAAPAEPTPAADAPAKDAPAKDDPAKDGKSNATPAPVAVRVTDEPRGAGRPAFTADGATLVYERSTGPDAITSELVRVAVPAQDGPMGTPAAIVTGRGSAGSPVVDGDILYYLGDEFAGIDFPGRTPGLFAVPLAGGAPRRLTDDATVHLDGHLPVVVGDRLLVLVHHRGAVELRSIPADAAGAVLDDLPVLVGGHRVVSAFAATGAPASLRVAAVVATPTTSADVVVLDVTPEGPGGERTVSDLGAPLREAGLHDLIELDGTAADGYPVHGWLLLPDTPGPHPVLLNVHGGPHASYGWGVFDEAQVYASAGYAVVMGNPRGSSGYGQDHGRAVVGAMGTVDVTDVLGLLDLALQRDDLDADRVGVMGGSYGGFMTGWLASHAPDRFVAGISERAVNAWDSFAGASDIGYFFATAYVSEERDARWAASPLAHADDIAIPLLIIHSEHDWRCPLEQAQRLFVALKMRGAETEMLLFPAEGHELSRAGKPQHRVQRFEAILEWWQRYLPVG